MSAANNEKNLTTEAWIVNATTRKASGYLFAAEPLIAKNLARKGPARFPDAAYWSIDGKSCFVARGRRAFGRKLATPTGLTCRQYQRRVRSLQRRQASYGTENYDASGS